MASVVIAGDTSGTVTLAAPAVAGTTTLTLPTANGTVITTGSSGQSIPKAALPTGSVLQVGYVTNSTYISTSSTTFQATDISIAFTPISATSKLILQCDISANFTTEPGGFKSRFYDVTGAAQLGNIYNCLRADFSSVTTPVYMYARGAMFWRQDSWGTTAKTIRVEFASIEGAGTADINTAYPNTQSTQFIIWEIAA